MRLARTFTTRVLLMAGISLLPAAAARTPAAQSQEEFARRQYESGLAFMKQQKYEEALKDFDTVINSYAASAVADDALLEIARYQLDVADDVAGADAATQALLKKYPSSDSAPMGRVMEGRITLAKGRSPAEMATALGSFERVPRIFPGTDAVPIAMYYAGEALRIGKRPDEALARFRQVAIDYPRSQWAGRALLGAGRCLVLLGQPLLAVEDFQRVRLRFPGTPEADTALRLNSILYRLHVRPPTLPVFTPSTRTLPGPGGKLKDVSAVAISAEDRVLVTSKSAVLLFGGGVNGSAVLPAVEPRSLFFNRRGRLVAGARGSIVTEADLRPVSVSIAKQDGTPRQLESIVAGVSLSTGDYLLADSDAKTISRFTAAGKHVAVFAPVNAERIAINAFDEIAVLRRDENDVAMFDRNGRPTTRLPARGAGYELKNPVDLAYDPLGNLYVLDRGRGGILVFSPQAKFIASYAPAEKTPGAFREAVAFALDSGGRVYLYDERAERVLIFQ